MKTGRKTKPADVLKFEKKSHKTKAEYERKARMGFSVGSTSLIEPAHVANDSLAHMKWVDLIREYEESTIITRGIITSVNVPTMARYCVLLAIEERLSEQSSTAEGFDAASIANTLLKLSAELRRIEDDLYLSYDARSRVETPKEDEAADPNKQMFGD
jgi:hypothetical protein